MKQMLGKGVIYCLLFVIVLAGCSSNNGEGKSQGIDPDKPVTLKVAFINEQMFYQSYGNVFSAKYPNVQFEVISTMEAAMSKDPTQAMIDLIDKNHPDVVMLTKAQYEALAAEGRLYELDSMVTQSGFDLEQMVEGVVQLLRDAGGGKLYGLAPTFNTNALYYNKDLFAKYGVPEPTDFMTWEEVLKLAARFPTDGDAETRIYGLASSMFAEDAFQLIKDMAAAKGLNYLNADATELTMSEPEWKEIFREVVEGYQNKTIHQPEPPQGDGGMIFSPDSMLFNNGRAAMVIDNSSMINFGGGGMAISTVRSSDGSDSSSSQPEEVNMGVVTAPVDAATPDMTSTYTVSQIFAINAASSQADMAWAFIQYVHGDEAAKIRSNTAMDLQSRLGYETNSNGVNLEPFYKLKPLPMETTQWYPKGFRSSFATIANEEISAASSGSKSVDEAFEAIVSRGADALAEANLSGEKEQGGGGGGGFATSLMFAG
ncbi:ABC transporter substrate-binding protein [Paenibacillus sp. NPDC057967]|uniref:ABC transporter substrate-binding protein n=1 Tax=Paenibacillus sp. NPDC057967 TaxID=3346293 RepID=UPI0036DDD253